jgi:diketogulonate reductase-like aldo/keto reductase
MELSRWLVRQFAEFVIVFFSRATPRHFHRHNVIKAAECSPKQLNTEYLDLYQLHWPNYTVPIGETMSAMEGLVEMGKIRFIGVSNFTRAQLRRAQSVLSTTRIVSNQVRYSLVDRTPEDELLECCEVHQISLLAFSPLATNFNQLRKCDPDDALGQKRKTRAQVTLNWCVSHPAVIAIFKADNAEHVRENCAASGWGLSAEHLHLLETRIRYRRRSRPEIILRGLVQCALQYAGRDIGNMTNMDREDEGRQRARG